MTNIVLVILIVHGAIVLSQHEATQRKGKGPFTPSASTSVARVYTDVWDARLRRYLTHAIPARSRRRKPTSVDAGKRVQNRVRFDFERVYTGRRT